MLFFFLVLLSHTRNVFRHQDFNRILEYNSLNICSPPLPTFRQNPMFGHGSSHIDINPGDLPAIHENQDDIQPLKKWLLTTLFPKVHFASYYSTAHYFLVCHMYIYYRLCFLAVFNFLFQTTRRRSCFRRAREDEWMSFFRPTRMASPSVAFFQPLSLSEPMRRRFGFVCLIFVCVSFFGLFFFWGGVF